jgi:hypothetical protein
MMVVIQTGKGGGTRAKRGEGLFLGGGGGDGYPFIVEELFASLFELVVAGRQEVSDVLKRRVLEGPGAQHRFEIFAPDLLLLQEQLRDLRAP